MTDKKIHKDMFQRELRVGQTVLRAAKVGNQAVLQVRKVTKLDERGVYLDDSHKVIENTNRLYVVGMG